MGYNADEERIKFWKIVDELLIENGEPFTVNYYYGGRVVYWGVINSIIPRRTAALELVFRVKEHTLATDIYIENDLPLYNIFLKHKDEIEKTIDKKIVWRVGTKNSNTRRIEYKVPISIGDIDNYRLVAEKMLPVVMMFIEIINRFGEGNFFTD